MTPSRAGWSTQDRAYLRRVGGPRSVSWRAPTILQRAADVQPAPATAAATGDLPGYTVVALFELPSPSRATSTTTILCRRTEHLRRRRDGHGLGPAIVAG